MQQQIALVTGASRGLGRELCRGLVERGFRVFSGVRNTTQAPENTTPILLELTDKECLERGVQEFEKLSEGRLDLLINNSGESFFGAPDTMCLGEVRCLFEVNFFGAFYLTQLLLPLMKKRGKGCLLYISSIRGVESCAHMGMYAASKAALTAMAFDWSVTLSKWNINVCVAEPGPIDTGIIIKEGSYYSKEENPYLPYPESILEFQCKHEAAKNILDQALQNSPPFRIQPSNHAGDIVAKHLTDPTGLKWQEEQLRALFKNSEDRG
jgi:NAD(P)-dependent dehydrogenase (short-subunit alcohol dehydrogenase family)